MKIRDEYRQKFAPILKALKEHRAELAAVPDLVIARPGFDPSEDALVPALVLAFRPPHRPSAVDYTRQFGVHTVEVEADPEEQLRASQTPGAVPALAQFLSAAPGETFAPAKYGNYAKPTGAAAPQLDAVDEEMKVTIAASPDAGWPLLKEFLDVRARERLTVGMYQFTAPHVYKALRENLRHGNARLSIGLDPKPEPIAGTGTKADDLYGPTILDRLERYLGPRFLFDWASVGKGAAFTTAYHIKVAVADGERFWLSTGNWQSSNLPPFDPINAPDDLPQSYGSNYNREYHVVIEHEQLASTYEKFLDYDRSLPGQFAQPVIERLPDLILPPEDPEALAYALRRWHEPLRLQRKLKVQPLLTPDNYAPHVLAALQSAKKSIYLQNQYISLNAQGDLKEFKDLVDALLEKIEAKLDVRIIVRDFMQPEKFDLLYAIGFPKDVFRVQKSCHAKLIVVDGKKAVVGSHNWSNDGTVTNRDASLLFDDVEVAEYLETIFLEDWERARRKAPRRQPRIARDGEKPFSGGRRAPWSAWSEEPPRVPAAATAPATSAPAALVAPPQAIAFGAPAPGGNVMPDVVTFNGIHARTGNYLMPEATLAEVVRRIRLGGAAAKAGEKDAATRRRTESFAPPFGTDPNDVKSSGWAVVWGPNTPASVKQNLKPLLDHRKARAGRFYQEHTVQPGESVSDFLTRCGVSLASGVKPHKLGYHVLLVASPVDVSFEFQYLLDLDYSVGRLHFDDEAGYGAYADATVRYETSLATPVRKREIAYWGPRHAGDGATALSSQYMVSALEHGEPELGSIAARVGASQHLYLANKASRKQLVALLGGGAAQPGLVFTAGHGMGVTSGEAGQKEVQGALLSSDWKGLGQIGPDDYVAAGNIDDNADATGLIAFFFACFGGGTPARDTFAADGQGDVIAPAPFVAALPQRLLGHPKRPALAVIGHVDRAWGLSIKPLGATDSQLGPYETFIGRVLRGECVGNGMTDLHGRAAILSSELGDLLMPGSGRSATDAELVYLWLQRNDARAYVLFGDPAVKLR